MSAPADRRPIERGEVLENPVTRERAIALELPWENAQGSVVAELTALPGARVAGEHLHPSLHERFTVIEGELTVVCDGRRSTVHAGESADIEPGTWHDWWNEAAADAARADRAAVLGHHRVPQAAAACPTRPVRRAGADRQTARLPRHLRQPLADDARPGEPRQVPGGTR